MRPLLFIPPILLIVSTLSLPCQAQTPPAPDLRPALNDSRLWFNTIKTLDPDSLVQLWHQPWLPPDNGPDQRRWQILRWLARAKPDQALALLAPLPEPKKTYWNAALWGWAERDPDAALAFVLDWDETRCPGLPQADLASVVFNVAIKAGKAPWVRANVEKLPHAVQHRALASWTWEWAALDGEAACRWIMQFAKPDQWCVNLSSGFAQWGRQDPDAAWTAVQELQGKAYDAALAGFARGLMIRDIAEGIRFLKEFQRAGRGVAFLDTVGLECGENHSEKGLAIWQALADDQHADLFAAAYLQRLTQKHPADAAALLPNITARQTQVDLADDIASAWHRQDPAAAVAWVESLANPDLQQSARKGLPKPTP